MQPLRGIIPPMATPFDADGNFDEALHRADVRYLIERARVHGVAVCGSTGEGHTLSTDETRAVAGSTAEELAGRAPMIVGVIANSTREAVEKGKAVEDLKPAALQVTPVHYLFRPDDDSMLRHFDAIAQATGLPVIIYNVVPWSYLSPDSLARILRESDGVIGVKQSAADMKALADLLIHAQALREMKTVRIFTAVDALLYPSFALGADGAIAAVLTAAPEYCVALWDAVEKDDHALSLGLHRKLLQIWNAIDGPNLPANVKTAMTLQGRQGGFPRAPMPPSSAEQTEKIREALA